MPRLICIVRDFTRYDEYAVKQINRNIDLIRYKKFIENFLMLELFNSNIAKPNGIQYHNDKSIKQSSDKTFQE
jgi:hypothetical protein